MKKTFALLLSFAFTGGLYSQPAAFPFRVRTITAGVTLSSLADTATLAEAVRFLTDAKKVFTDQGYTVQTLRIATNSFGRAIETYTQQPFGNPSTLGACALITDVLKSLDVKKCGYSGLMLPVIEDPVLAKRAAEGRYTIEELLLFSSVSGTGLDVVPIAGDTPVAVIEGILTDVAALSLKYTAKALSARLFPLPGKKAGDRVEFANAHLTGTTVMRIN